MDPVRDKKSTTYWNRTRFPLLGTILRRWWWPAMFVIGYYLAQAYVTPYEADAQNAINKIHRFEVDRLEELDAEYTTKDNERFAVEAMIDTLALPELDWATATLDSLHSVRSGIEATFPTLEQGIAMLTGQLEALQDPLREAQLTKETTEREIVDYRASIETLRDSVTVLLQRQEALKDRLYRLENPQEFDRTRALISPGRTYK